MRLVMVIADCIVDLRDIPPGVSPEVLTEYAHVISSELLAVFEAGRDMAIPPEAHDGAADT
jgi:hypothetical protein